MDPAIAADVGVVVGAALVWITMWLHDKANRRS